MAKKKPRKAPSRSRNKGPVNKKKRSGKQKQKQEVQVKDLISPSLIQKYGLYVMLGLILLVVAFVFQDFIFQESIYFFKDIGSDSYNSYLPGYYHYAYYLQDNGIPTWTFHQGMGQNLFPGGINSFFTLLLYTLGPEGIAPGMVWIEILKVFLAGFLFFQYAKMFGIERIAAIFGGVIFAFLGYLILGSTGWYGHSENVVLSIFLLFSFEAFYQKKQWWFFPIAVFLISANPFRLYLNGLFILLYSLLRVLSEENDPKKVLTFYAKLIGLGTLGVGLTALFSFGTLMRMINSPRVSGGFGAEKTLSQQAIFGFAGALEQATCALRLFSNDILGNGSNFKGYRNYLEAPVFYSGLFTLVLIPQLFQFLTKRQKITHGVLLTLVILPVIFPYFRYAMFLFIGDYYKHGLSMFLPLTFVVYGIWSLHNIIKHKKVHLLVLLGTLGLLFLILFFPYETVGNSTRPIDGGIRNTAGVLILLYAGGLLGFKYVKQKQVVLLALLGLVFIEAGYMTNKTVNQRDAINKKRFNQKEGYNDHAKDAVAHLKSVDDGFYRVNKDYLTTFTQHASLNDAKMQRFYGTPSYTSFNQLYYVRFLTEVGAIRDSRETDSRWARGVLLNPLLHPFASIKYGITKQPNSEMLQFGFDPLTTIGNVNVLQNSNYLPLGFTYDKYILYDDFKGISKLQKEMMMYKAVVVDEPLANLTPFNLADTSRYIVPEYSRLRDLMNGFAKKYQELDAKVKQGNASGAENQSLINQRQQNYDQYSKYGNQKNRLIEEMKGLAKQRGATTFNISSHSHKKIEGTINLAKSQMLFFSIPFDEGWQITVDGQEVDPMVVNVGFTGIPLEAGEHNISLRYRVPHITWGLFLSLISLLVYIGLILYPRFKKETAKPAKQQ